MDTNYIYFVDRDGDVARAKRAVGGQKRKKAGAEGGQEAAGAQGEEEDESQRRQEGQGQERQEEGPSLAGLAQGARRFV